MEPISLSINVIAPAFGIAKSVRGFYKDCRDVPEELEKFANQAETWEAIITAAHCTLRGACGSSINAVNAPERSDAISKQYKLCMKLLHQLSDDLKMSPDVAKRCSWERIRKAFRRKEIGKSMTELRNCCDQFSLAASLDLQEQNGRKIKGLQSSVDDLRSNVGKHHTRVDKRDILQWITDECQWDAHFSHKEEFQEGTLDAVLNSDQYYNWQNGVLDDDDNAVAPATLWCHGPPGAGKSTLVYAIIEQLRWSYGQDAVIVHAYSNYEKQDSQSAETIIACMVRTAVSQYETIPDFVVEEWKKHSHGLSPIRLPTLRILLCELLRSRRKSFILIDALDEITSPRGNNERQLEPDDVLNEVIGIVEMVNKLKADQGQICCRALFTSREKCPGRFSAIKVSEMLIKATEADVQLTLEALIDRKHFRHLNEKITQDASLRALIVNKISMSAKGVFLLAKLQIEYLRQFINLRDLTEALEDLPQDLQESHKRSMKRIRNQTSGRRMTGLKALSLVYHANGMLTVESAQQALVVRDGDESFNKYGINEDEMLINLTAGLLATRSGCLVFVHHTVKEFLRKPEGNGSFDDCKTTGTYITQSWFTEELIAHGYIANQCLLFLLLKNFLEPLDAARRELRAKTFPFLDYAVNNVGYHAYRATALEDKHYALTQKCRTLLDEGSMPLGSLQEFLARMWTNPAPARVTNLHLPKTHLAVLCNFVDLATDLVTVDNVNDRATVKDETVLHFAARIKSQDMVEMILAKGADRNLVNYSGKTPLDMILVAPLQRIFFESETAGGVGGNSEKPPSSQDKIAFHLMFFHYLESRAGMQLVLKTGEDSISLSDLEQVIGSRTATNVIAMIIEKKLKLTISEEGENLAALMISAGIDINSQQTSRETPLQLATLYEIPSLVKLLLEKGANPYLAWHCSFTAAEIAEKRGNSELLKILRDKEKEIDSQESSMKEETDKESKRLHRVCADGSHRLTTIQDIPGRSQALHLVRESRKLVPKTLERMKILEMHSMDDGNKIDKLQLRRCGCHISVLWCQSAIPH